MGIHHFLDDPDQGSLSFAHGQAQKSETKYWSRQQEAKDMLHSGSQVAPECNASIMNSACMKSTTKNRRRLHPQPTSSAETASLQHLETRILLPSHSCPKDRHNGKTGQREGCPMTGLGLLNAHNTHVQLIQATYQAHKAVVDGVVGPPQTAAIELREAK